MDNRFHHVACLFSLACACAVVCCRSAMAQSFAHAEQTPPSVEPNPPIEQQAEPTSDALISPDPLEPALKAVGFRPLQGWLNERNLSFNLGFTVIGQYASDVEEKTHGLVTGSYDFEMTYTIPFSETATGTVGLLIDGGQVIDHNQSEDLSANVGDAFGLNADADNEPVRIAELWYAQGLGRIVDEENGTHIVTAVIGRIDQTTYFDTNRIANDETGQFIASPLVNNAAVAFPARGPGFNVTVKPDEMYYVSAGYGNAAAEENTISINTIDDGDYFVAAELGVTPTFGNDLAGAYRLLFWGTEIDDANGAGVALSMDQEIAKGIVPFARLGYGDDDVSAFEWFASAGVGFEDAFGRRGHLLAVGLAWGKTAEVDGTGGISETLVETFYRFPLTESIAISPDLQFVINPVDSSADVVVVGGLRLQASF